MSPWKCPACGRFLRTAFVATLSNRPAPCPGCDAGLVAAMFPDEESAEMDAARAAETTASSTGPAPVAVRDSSVRPPDLRPATVRDDGDVLEGWDRMSGPPPIVDRAPFPVDAAVVCAAGVAGGLLAGWAGRGWRGAALGAVGGVVGASVSRRIWRLA